MAFGRYSSKYKMKTPLLPYGRRTPGYGVHGANPSWPLEELTVAPESLQDQAATRAAAEEASEFES
jgi:hypothetical protein